MLPQLSRGRMLLLASFKECAYNLTVLLIWYTYNAGLDDGRVLCKSLFDLERENILPALRTNWLFT